MGAAAIGKRMKYWLAISLIGLFVWGGLWAQMLDPVIDRDDEPFCYFSQPTDQIGIMDGREGTLISPEGYLYAGSGELMFFIGNPPVPTKKRVKTLSEGFLPVVQYQLNRDGFDYQWTIFAVTLDGSPESPLVNFVRVKIINQNPWPRTTWFATGVRYQNDANTDWGVGDNRFGRPVKPERTGEFEQAGLEFSQDWHCLHLKDRVLYDDKLLYTFPEREGVRKFLTWKMGYNEPPAEGEMTLYVLPTTPVGIVQYPLTMQPGEEIKLDFKFPYMPVDTISEYSKQIRQAEFNVYLARTEDFWEKTLSRGMFIELPEKKVTDTFKASLINSLIARDKIDSFFVQKVNEFQYDNFWLRDAAFFSKMYDITGYSEESRQVLDFFPRWQQEDGNFVSQGGQYDGFGQTLWAYGQHVRMTGDRSFALEVFPSVLKAIDWLETARHTDSLNLIPVTTPGDNENITGHVTGHNFWALIGLKNAIYLAEILGKSEKALELRAIYNDYFKTFMTVLTKITAQTNGYIPPGLEGKGGNDWGNLLSVYPDQILDPMHKWVTKTLAIARSKYQEGIMTYGDGRWLHHYLTLRNTETALVRDEQETVIRDLYAVLLHTSATHAGFEFSILPWKDRDFGMNLSPHGWFAAEYRILLRNMMVREQGDTLHLLSAISPQWVQRNEKITVSNAPTEFGPVDFTLSFGRKSASLVFKSCFTRVPAAIVFHLPWFMQVREVCVEGHSLVIRNGAVTLPVNTRQVEMDWSFKKDIAELSFSRTVDDYKREYRWQYEKFLREGN